MGLGSENSALNKDFYKIAGGQKWKLKIQTAKQAVVLIDAIKHLPDSAVKERIQRLKMFIVYKEEGPLSKEVWCVDCNSKLYDEGREYITLAEYEGIHCQRKPRCNK